MIKIQNYDKERQKIEFVSDMQVGLANAIRRSVLEIPVMAIDEVEIIKNDSALFDEVLAHRIGLVPIKTEKTSRETKFKLKKAGPGIIYSTDISPSIDTEYRLPLVFLGEGQEVEMIANAKLGIGTDHIKYSPGLFYYKHNLDNNLLDFVTIDDSGKVNFDEESTSKEKIEELKGVKEVKELIICIESWGQLEPREIFTSAVDILNKNLDELNKSIK